jgi:small subunit ribosomal protein S27e
MKHLSSRLSITAMGFFDSDLRYPKVKSERQKHKLTRLVQGPNAFFMDVKCPSCAHAALVYSHSTTAVNCRRCSTLLSHPTGGKAKLSEGCQFRAKAAH